MPSILADTLQTLDRLDPHDQAVVQAVLEARQEAGVPVTPAQAIEAFMGEKAARSSAVDLASSSATSRWKRGWHILRKGVQGLKGIGQDLLGTVGLLGIAGLVKFTYGQAGLAVITSNRFSQLLLLCFSLWVAAWILRGTLRTARDGTLLGQSYSSVWLPFRVVVLSMILLPCGDVSPLAWMIRWLWG